MADSASKKTIKKATKPKKPSSHPKYADMIIAAITSLKERTGSSGQAIKKYIVANYKVEATSAGPHLRLALRRGVASGALKQMKGTGASGSFKVADKTAKPKKVVKKIVITPATTISVKSPKKAAKKTATKKPAPKKSPKKSVKKVAKSPAKKPKAKKAKKVAAKK